MKNFGENALRYLCGLMKDEFEKGGGVYIGDTAPSNTKLLWVDTASGNITKFYNGSSWVATKAVWS